MDEFHVPGFSHPTTWFVVFHTVSTLPWLGRLTPGRFKHASAFAYVPGFKVWLFYDVQWSGVRLSVASQTAAEGALRTYSAAGCEVVKIERREGSLPLRSRLGFYCVPAIGHLIGLSCVARTPDGLYKAILRNGGLPIEQRPSPAAD